VSLTEPGPDWAKEHIGGPLHLQVAAPPAGRQRGYEHHSALVQPVQAVRPTHPSAQAAVEERGGDIWVTTKYNLHTVTLRDPRGHLRMWTGYVAEGYWS
jgi:hypothetical protein